MRQWGGLGKSREWTGGCEGLVCNCVDSSNRGTLPCPVDLGWPATTDFAVHTYAAGGCLALQSRLTVLSVFTWSTWYAGPSSPNRPACSAEYAGT